MISSSFETSIPTDNSCDETWISRPEICRKTEEEVSKIDFQIKILLSGSSEAEENLFSKRISNITAVTNEMNISFLKTSTGDVVKFQWLKYNAFARYDGLRFTNGSHAGIIIVDTNQPFAQQKIPQRVRDLASRSQEHCMNIFAITGQEQKWTCDKLSDYTDRFQIFFINDGDINPLLRIIAGKLIEKFDKYRATISSSSQH